MKTLEYEMSSFGLVADTIISDGKFTALRITKIKTKTAGMFYMTTGTFKLANLAALSVT